MKLDQAIAATNCNADKEDIKDLMDLGFFNPERTCEDYLLPNGGVDYDGDGYADDYDTVCYHSNIQTAFLS